ncbi:MAG: hypothetical protein A2039_06565 [Candidatus Melainabacteria bacterium GWA2_34_9]|nr:MAG: hypothetical protein A2039_06565 [Candidatus Melainabacteria bacterium GWA2_34_9]
MQTIGLNPQKNNKPAFGCNVCGEIKQIFLNNKIKEEIADKFIKEETKPLSAGLFRKARTHESMAEYCLGRLKKDFVEATSSFFKDSGGCAG